MLWNFEDIVIRNCPGFCPARYFSVVGESDDSLIGYMFNVKMAVHKRDKDTALTLTAKALARVPGEPELEKLRRMALAM